MIDNDLGDTVLIVWLIFWFSFGVLSCALAMDRAIRRWGVHLWWMAFVVVVAGVSTLFMMFIFPELVFGWDFCYQRNQCESIQYEPLLR